MNKTLGLTLICVFAAQFVLAQDSASKYPRVDADLAVYDAKVKKMKDEFSLPEKPRDKEWVKAKIAHMVKVDQFMRSHINHPHRQKYSEEETQYFFDQFSPRFEAVDKTNTKDLKKLTAIHGWFKISEFGKDTDHNAWLLVQHADLDVVFQKEILTILEKLYSKGETSPQNFAYLHDRVAVAELRPQRYGTQGQCAGPGKWEPFTLENPKKINELRKSVGLEPMEEYKKRFKDICH